MVHGDAVDDEWLAVWMLREAAKTFPELIISVRDSDGEFLLAEAAMHIPHWITPENSNNRVLIHGGRLHIVPLSTASAAKYAENENIELEDALHAVTSLDVVTLASTAAEKAAFARLEGYPSKTAQSMHRTRCKLPASVAKVLQYDPQLLAAAVEAFYSRDSSQFKACQTMRNFAPEPAAMVPVSFNRVQYAKLASQNISAPSVFNIPPEQAPDYKACVLGMKIACGFEILSQNHQGDSILPNNSSSSLDAEISDSVAVSEFLGHLGHATEPAPSPDSLIEQSSLTVKMLLADMAKNGARSTVGCSSDYVEDDDSWLTLHPDELDALMQKAESILKDASQEKADGSNPTAAKTGSGHCTENGGGHLHENEYSTHGLENVLASFQAFLTANSGVEGAEMLGDHRGTDYDESSDEDIDLDVDGVIGALMDAIGINSLEELDSAHRASLGNVATVKSTPGGIKEGAVSATTGIVAHSEQRIDPADEMYDTVVAAMDRELQSTHIGRSFVRHDSDEKPDENSSIDELDDMPDVDVDLNLVENIVQSFRAQEGLPGPAGTFLGQFGVHLPRIDSDDDAEEKSQS
ncbi:hypothetical protein GGI07_001469 [Coemansia sp. Benny D115]|nr:hypothetical protein GGI07_001469 [Coemansia sp. Benny D115]